MYNTLFTELISSRHEYLLRQDNTYTVAAACTADHLPCN